MAGLPELEARVKKIEDFLTNLSAFESGPHDWLGFDIQDGSHDEDSRQHKDAPQGAFLTGIETYIEDAHIKMVFGHKTLPKFKP
ncbi:hypothetical protein HU675_0037315 [Bradyrhizobium septentrionale]|uniref:hypothetical protein n=1 Tax=Bradyrhizobium septentrionale TaxID=1404411 RepID=UPI001596D7FC|nr:hypothetical protein [Bradyrhizobium septentrionale]UGY23558.1 hypothetical protein HU675_0037315 [Bradyrhizobium septentrionale]